MGNLRMIYRMGEESFIVLMEMLSKVYGRKDYLKIFYEVG